MNIAPDSLGTSRDSFGQGELDAPLRDALARLNSELLQDVLEEEASRRSIKLCVPPGAFEVCLTNLYVVSA